MHIGQMLRAKIQDSYYFDQTFIFKNIIFLINFSQIIIVSAKKRIFVYKHFSKI